jgi:hypothetical protein
MHGVHDDPRHLSGFGLGGYVGIFVDNEEEVHQIASGAEMLCGYTTLELVPHGTRFGSPQRTIKLTFSQSRIREGSEAT